MGADSLLYPLAKRQGASMNDVPICIGMPRSASRMTWQIVNQLLQPEPGWWQQQKRRESPDSVDECNFYPWPDRRHEYVKSIDPVIYTYRNPIEAYLSYRSRFSDPDSGQDCLQQVIEHRVTIANLKQDQLTGRRVLWLRYEDYYGNDRARIGATSRFLGKKMSNERIHDLLEHVSIETNLRRSQNVPDVARRAPFGRWMDPVNGIQADHVNQRTMGRVGAHLALHHVWSSHVVAGEIAEFEELGIFTKELGYT